MSDKPEFRQTALIAHPSADLYGSDRVLLETVTGLMHGDFDVVVTVPSAGPLVEAVELRGATVLIRPTPVLRKAFLSPKGLVRLALESVRGLLVGIRLVRDVRPAVVYINTLTIPLWPVVARLTRTPSLVHVHEAEGTASDLVRKVIAAPLFLADALITNSQFSVDVLASSFPRLGAKCRIITNGVPGPSNPVPARGELGERVQLVYVGRLSHRKGPDLVVEAVAELLKRDLPADLHIIGAVFPGNEAFEDKILRRVEELELTDFVHFHGFQSEVWPFLAEADIAVVPSRLDEPFGNTAVEAMLAARPAIVSDTSGLREASSGFSSVLRAEPSSVQAIVEAVATIVSEWKTFRDAALTDADLARSRNGTEAYRAAVAAEVDALRSGATR